MGVGIGSTGQFTNNGGSTGTITLSTVDSSGLLVLFAEANDATSPTVSSTTLGSWGSPRIQITGATGIFEWTKPFTGPLTNEAIDYTGFTGGFTNIVAVEVRGVPASSYFDTNVSIPASAVTLPLTVNTTGPDTIIISAIRSTVSSNIAGAGWTPISLIDFFVVQYQIAISPQVNLPALLGGGVASSNGLIMDAFVSAVPSGPGRPFNFVESGRRY